MPGDQYARTSMHAPPVNIKVLVAAGTPVPGAIKAALGHNGVTRFAREKGFPHPNVSACIYGRQRHDRVRAALADQLGVDRPWLDSALDGLREVA
jgi:hypothetical protein